MTEEELQVLKVMYEQCVKHNLKDVFISRGNLKKLIEQAEIKIQQDSIVEALVGEEILHQQGLLKPETMRLQEENKRLREALEIVYSHCEVDEMDETLDVARMALEGQNVADIWPLDLVRGKHLLQEG